MLNTLNVNLNTDLKVTRVPELGIKIKSQDINNNLFILRFTDKGKAIELDETYTVEILTKFEKSKSHRLTSATVYRDYARWEFDTSFITQDEKVTNYVYVRKSGSLVVSADANAFAFDVGLSEIDKVAGRVAEVYDENYQKYLDEFKDVADFTAIQQAEQDRQDAEILRQESYDAKVTAAIVEADVVEKVDNKVTELTPQINDLTAQLAQKAKKVELIEQSTIKPLLIHSFDGAMDALHPSVVYIPNGFNGYKFWMAYTPFTVANPYMDRWECPSIAHSLDGVDWKTPAGLNNPLDDLSASEITAQAYYSDPTLVYNNDLNRLEIFYRFTVKGSESRTMIYRKTSSDGFTWSARVLVYDSNVKNNLTQHEALSPQVLYKNGTYRMYYAYFDGSHKVAYVETTDSGIWDGTPTICTLTGYPPGRNEISHIGIYHDETTGEYHMLAMESYNGAYKDIIYFKSTDGISFNYQGVSISHANKVGYKVKDIYQTVMTKVNGEWLVYCTVRVQYNHRNNGAFVPRNMIALFTGDNLLNLSPADGGVITTRQVHMNDIVLANSEVQTNNREVKLVLLENDKKTESLSLGINRATKAPSVIKSVNTQGASSTSTLNRYTIIPAMRDEIKDPDVAPEFAGQLWRNWSKLFYGYDPTSVNGWLRLGNINFDGSVTYPKVTNTGIQVNKKVADIDAKTTLDVTSQYLMNIRTMTNATIESLTGGEDGQEIIITNAQSTPIVIKHNTGTSGKMYLKGQVDRTLAPWLYESIRLIRYNGNWIEI